MQEKFDPISEESGEMSKQDNIYFDATTGELAGGTGGEAPKKKKLLPLIISLAVVLAAAAAVVLIGIFSGAFISDKNKVIAAIGNTFEVPEIVKVLDFNDIVTSGAYTVGIESEIDDVSFHVDYLRTKDKQAVNGNIGSLGINGEFSGILDDNQLKLQIPFLDDEKILVYHYDRENTGYLMEILEEYGVNDQVLNQFLDTLYNGTEESDSSLEVNKELFQNIWEIYKNLEFKKLEKRTFTIDGNNVSCNGYETVITAQMMKDTLNHIQNAMNEQPAYSAREDMQEVFDNLREVLSSGNVQVRLKFYIYKKKLAAVRAEVNEEDIEIRFEGGNTRTQNMGIYMSGLKMMEVKGTTEGQKDTSILSSMGTELMRWSYDKGTGEFDASLSLYNYGYSEDNYSIRGKITNEDEYGEIDISELNMGDGPMKMKITIQKGADIKDIEGEEFDIGNATVYELMEFFGKIYEQLY